MAKDYKIKDFLKRIKNTVEIKDGVSYKRVTVSGNHKGVSLRDKVDGSKIGTKKQFTITGGDFILSKIDARNGAFGIIPKSLDGAIITGNFWTYKVDTQQVNIEWFFYFTHSFNFIQICIESSTGSTHRKYLDEKVFLNHDIVLPNKAEQIEMVKRYKEQSNVSNNLSKEIRIQKVIISQLKQSILQEAIQGKLTQEWRANGTLSGVEVEPASELLKRIKAEKEQLIKDKNPSTSLRTRIKKEKPLPPITEDEIPFELPESWVWCRLGDTLLYSDSGKSPNCKKLPVRGNEWGVLTTTAIQQNKFKENENKVLPISFKVNPIQQVFKNDILITRAGPLNRTGVSCKVDSISSNLILSDKTIRLVHPPKLMNPDFISQSLNSQLIRKLLVPKMTGMAKSQVNISQKNIKLTEFPLPPLAEQKAIVEKIESLLQKCNALEQEIAQSEQHANMLMQAVLKEAFERKENKIIELPKLLELESSHFPKRKMLASYIINQSANDKQFGDTKFEKLLHLADYHILKRNFGQEYKQKAAGPYDNKFTVPFFNQTIKAGWFYKQSLGNMNRILPGKNNSKSQTTYDYFSEEELRRIDNLINTFKQYNYEQPEIISTIYAVWNNRIIRNQEITNELLKQDFLDWDKGKAQYVYPKDRVTPAIKWMKENGFIPDGWGKIIELPKSKSKKK